MQNAQYIPADFDIAKIKEALITGEPAKREYALRLINTWKRPGDDHGFSASNIREMKKWGSN